MEELKLKSFYFFFFFFFLLLLLLLRHIDTRNSTYYIDTDKIPGFFLLLKSHIFITRGEDTTFILRYYLILWPACVDRKKNKVTAVICIEEDVRKIDFS